MLAISKRLKLQEPDCIQFEENWTQFIFFFLKLVAVLEDEISLVEGVGILIGKVVRSLPA